MNQPKMKATGFLLGCAALLAGACTTSPTGTTKDMFDFTSSTTPGAWYSQDGMLNPEYRPIAFATYNYQTVKRDIARGGGEHLVSLATLLGVSPSGVQEFGMLAQSQYADVESPRITPEQLLSSMQSIVENHPHLARVYAAQ